MGGLSSIWLSMWSFSFFVIPGASQERHVATTIPATTPPHENWYRILCNRMSKWHASTRDCIAPMSLMENALMLQLPSLLVVSSCTVLFMACHSCKENGHEDMGSQATFRGMWLGW